MTVEPTSGLPMHMGLCRGHVGVVWWVWLGRAVRVHTYVHTFVHTCVTVNEVVHTHGGGMNRWDQAPRACQGHAWASY